LAKFASNFRICLVDFWMRQVVKSARESRKVARRARELVRRARELVPNIAVVYVSADSGPDWTSSGVPKSVLVIKPFAEAQIVTAIATLITEADTQF